MGYAMLVGYCALCGHLVTCNPDTVPSYKNQPVCLRCITEVNHRRAQLGLPPVPVPADAYQYAEWPS